MAKKVILQKATLKPIKKTAKKIEVLDVENVVSVHIRFENVGAGNSLCTVTHNNQDSKTLHQSGDVNYNDALIGDTIEVDGISAGKTTITVSGANTVPVKMVFVAGQQISGFFSIMA